jgi:acyl-CoA synthetase (AMP-forming)/AMP-acid ligase II
MTGMDLAAILDTAAHRRPRAAAVRCGRVELDYAALRDLANRIGRALEQQGAGPGERVAALFPNCHLHLALHFAALARGLVLVPLNLRLRPGEIAALLEHSGARLLAGGADLVGPLLEGGPVAERLRGGAPIGADGWLVAPLRTDGEGAATRAPDGAAALYYTSGTTGHPKGVVLTRGNLEAHAAMTLDELGWRETDVWLHAAPMFHLADAWAIWTATAAGAEHRMLPRFGPASAFEMLAGGITITNLVPTMLRAVLAEAERRGGPLRSLRLLLSGGAPIAPRTVEQIETRLGCPYAQTYGLTETSPFLTFSLLGEAERDLSPAERLRLRARTGRPARGVQLRVVVPASSERFEDVPADDRSVGEVVVRGPTVTPGYWRDPEATREAFLGGWFHTGDLGTLDAGGFLNLVDRAKDVVITGGETVYSTEVEHLLYEHPAVREAAVFGVPDDRWGERVRAAIVLAEGRQVTAEELIAFCRDRAAHFKCPRHIDILPALPRTGSGKIDKKTLREPHWRGRERRIN